MINKAWTLIVKMCRDSATGIDGATFDPARVLWIVGVITFLVLSVHTTYTLGKAFDYQSFGIGLGAVLAGGGFAVNVKASTEPKKAVVVDQSKG
jgi:hypothetical protein